MSFKIAFSNLTSIVLSYLCAVLGAMTMADGSASGMMISLIGPFFGVGILWAVLQISKNGHTCWSQLR